LKLNITITPSSKLSVVYENFISLKFNYFRFPVGRWLDINEGDKRISLELEPNKKPSSKTPTGK
jgi:hypothetical protein